MVLGIFDLAIVGIIAISSLLGLYRGATAIIINLVGFVLSIFLSFLIHPYIEVFCKSYIQNEALNAVASGIASYIISLAILTILCSQIISALKHVSSGFIDRSAGLIFGFIRGVLISAIIFNIIAIIACQTYINAKDIRGLINNISRDHYPSIFKDSAIAPYLEQFSKTLISQIPDDMIHSISLPELPKELPKEIDLQ